jgi:hypothetical protein
MSHAMKHILLWVILANQGAVTVDTWATRRTLAHGGHETNPLTRPITQLPAPAHYAVMETSAGLTSFVGWRMKNSKHKLIRKTWWIVPSFSAGESVYGAARTIHAYRPR